MISESAVSSFLRGVSAAGDWEYRVFIKSANPDLVRASFERYGTGKSKKSKRTDLYIPSGPLCGVKVRDAEGIPPVASTRAAFARTPLEIKVDNKRVDTNIVKMAKFEDFYLESTPVELRSKFGLIETQMTDLHAGADSNIIVAITKARQKDNKKGLSHEATECDVTCHQLGGTGKAPVDCGKWLSICLEHGKLDKLTPHVQSLNEFLATHGVEPSACIVDTYAGFVHQMVDTATKALKSAGGAGAALL
jgi:hypothetical protein